MDCVAFCSGYDGGAGRVRQQQQYECSKPASSPAIKRFHRFSTIAHGNDLT
jgi:hypothetical protein